MTPSAAAAGAYANAARLADPVAAVGKASGEGSGSPSFGALLKDALGSVMEAGQRSDAKAQAMITGAGKADMIDVVTAVSETEVAVQTLVAVRDKVIEAYQNVMQMPI
jgi:flagellar hook-basal body complex protein FliE